MALGPGTRIGPYEVAALIGAGGMGEVYRATDTNLKRQVAIKVLPDAVAGDADRLARFQREAEVLAALNHPNIAVIHGLERSGSVTALVMELVEGPTLADRIAQGNEARRGGSSDPPIPIDEALSIAKQIAEALEAAHEQGIIHRDLKPANIKVRPDGTVKVLDFGLAKAMEPASAISPSVSQSPTITTPAMTQAGMILGTAAYMSPEQARGKPVDKRADVWAFGCVLYEMLTGRRAFEAEDVSLTMARVLEREVDFDALPAAVPTRVRQTLRLCLRKDPRQRLGDARAAVLALEGAFEDEHAARAGQRSAAGWRRSFAVGALGVALVAGALAAGFVVGRSGAADVSDAARTVRLSVPFADGQRLVPSTEPNFALSRDGQILAYRAGTAAQGLLQGRRLAEGQSRTLLGTEGAAYPFFSPNGQWIGFFTPRSAKLKKVSLTTGTVETLVDAPVGRGGSWGDDDTIYFSQASGIWSIPASGGEPVPVTTLDTGKGDVSHRWPQLLPGGRALVFTVWQGPGLDEKSVEVLTLPGRERRVLVQRGDMGRVVGTGHLVYARGRDLFAAPMQLDSLTVDETRVVQLPDVIGVGDEGAAFSPSEAGHLAYIAGDPRGVQTRLVRVTRTGAVEPFPVPVGDYQDPSLSPDGNRIAVTVDRAALEIWVLDVMRASFARLTGGDEGSSQAAVWTPDGDQVVYRGTRAGSRNLWRKAASGGAPEVRVTTKLGVLQTPTSIAADGRIVFSEAGSAGDVGGASLWSVREGSAPEQPWTSGDVAERAARLSPDGQWVAYSAGGQVHLRPFPGPGAPRQVSTTGGREPVWSRNGRELFFREGNGLMVVDVQTQPALSLGLPRTLFSDGSFVNSPTTTASYDVSPDGTWFVFVESLDPELAATRIEIVMNWFEELKRLVPTN